jgi:PAS domain S-box-containing protein
VVLRALTGSGFNALFDADKSDRRPSNAMIIDEFSDVLSELYPGIVVVHQAGDATILYGNPKFDQLRNAQASAGRSDAGGSCFTDVIHPDFREEYARVVSRLEENQTHEGIFGLLAPDDSVSAYIFRLMKKRLPEGDMIAVLGNETDASQVHRLEDDYHRLFRSMRNGFALHEIICDAHGTPVDYRFLDISPSFEQLTGLGRDILGRTVLEILPDTEPYWIETYGKVALTGVSTVISNYSRDLDKHFEVTAYCPGPNQFATIFEDVTERHQARMALQKSEANLSAIIENNPDVIFSVDTEYRVITANSSARTAFDRAFGQPLEPGVDVLSLVSDERASRWRRRYDEVLRGKRGHYEEKVVHEDGERYADVFLNPIISNGSTSADDRAGHVSGISVYIRDITRRIVTEQERVRLQMAIDQAAEAVMITDADGAIVYVNPAFTYISGYSKMDILGQNPRLLQSGRHDKVFYQTMWGTLTEGKVWEGTFENRRKDGSHYFEKAVISPVMNLDGNIVNYVAVKRDITEELRKDNLIRQSEKMEALGQLSGGIAHDFNNILGAIVGYGDLLKEDLPEDSPESEHVRQILVAAERARQLVNQILAFSRQQKQKKEVTAVKQIIYEAVTLLRAALPATLTIDVDISYEPYSVLADPIQIHELLMNLCTNGARAMHDSGTLKVSCDLQYFDGSVAGRLGPISPGNYVTITVSDMGCGMDSDVLEHIFDPFYTTREVGQGTGMGLSVVFGIVQKHEGNILVDSEIGKGSRFHILLPPYYADSAVAQFDSVKPQGVVSRILLVDTVNTSPLIGRILQGLGHDVVIDCNPKNALAVLKADPESFDMVMADYRVMGAQGIDLLARLLNSRNELKVVVTASTGDGEISDVLNARGISNVWRKPFGKNRLRDLISELYKS